MSTRKRMLAVLPFLLFGFVLVGFHARQETQPEPALPEPWNQISSLSSEQRRTIRRIIDQDNAGMADRRSQIQADRGDIFKRLGLDSEELLKCVTSLNLDAERLRQLRHQRLKIIQRLGLTTQRADEMLRDASSSIELNRFHRFKASQTEDVHCWAACIQMLFNYNCIDWSQDEIVEEIKGMMVRGTARPDEIVNGVTGWRQGLPGQEGQTWRAYSRYHREALDPSRLVGLLQFNRMILVGLGERHLAVLHAARYRETTNERFVDSVVVYDPLANADFTWSWDEASRKITEWWEAYVVPPGNSIFIAPPSRPNTGRGH